MADYRSFVGLSVYLEEMVATRYLNQLQVPESYPDGKINDSTNWTAEDRRTALYWIYINTRDNTVINQSYECSFCQKEHGRQMDLCDLIPLLVESEHSMTEKLDIPNIKPGYIQPLRGNAVEYLEQLRNTRDELEEDSPEWCVAHADLRIYECAWALKFKDDDKSLSAEDQAENRFEYLLTLDAEKAFKKVAATVRKALSAMRHGLMSEYLDGEYKLVTPPHQCPNIEEGDEPVETVLLLPFRYNNFLPSL
ncbi:hypothetical protein HWV00_21235 (plasmid) [Moritella sp. 24]|uniref:hypothetical protein n=1 Tax=Moritella sp. 24 TaxID=2746230 RepID=UPI001BAC7800|nr:hypothetical protein [Moritella sp. 24]QUM78799.1 hypothetical protein HWV00_21235 [Moritella sp. 24]